MTSAKPRRCPVRPVLGKGCWVEAGTLGRGEAEMKIETEFEKVLGETEKDAAARERREGAPYGMHGDTDGNPTNQTRMRGDTYGNPT